MTVAYDTNSYRGWSSNSQQALALEDKYEILKDIGDGSFGSVSLGRTRSAGASVVRRGTMVAIKTMKKTFENFSQCMELREVIFLKTLPSHPHLVPAYDIFLDPLSRKLHIAMEYMDGNLYQLMKARDHKPMDGSVVKSILFQILSGLEHIHDHSFFHRDIKPENILVSTSATETGHTFKRYSSLVTPPSTPPTYSIKIADFGLARETHSRIPYTTYVSTRWYRAPEVLLRAGEYSAPVDIWAIGAMAVEIATLKPLFPGGNEVDQVWRVCEIMGSPSNWVVKGQKVGGGEWRDGIKLAQKLGFSFPKMAPHSLETVLPAPQWPASLAQFVTWCLMWDPKARPTSRQALEHEYFADAVDPLIRPKSSSTQRLLGRKSSTLINNSDSPDSGHALATKTSLWFRKSLGGKDSAPAVPEHAQAANAAAQRPAPVHANTEGVATLHKRPSATKRSTWTTSGAAASNPAPIPILPSVKPISPLPDNTTVQASARRSDAGEERKKIGRQLSNKHHENHYADIHRQEAERMLEGGAGLKSPTGSQRESFFSHLRKRARRLSGRNQGPMSPNADDLEANVGCAPWAVNNNNNNRSSIPDAQAIAPMATDPSADPNFAQLDKALQNVRYSLDATAGAANAQLRHPVKMSSNPALKRHHSLPYGTDKTSPSSTTNGPISSRTRRSVRQPNPVQRRYETPDEEEELLDEAITSAHKAANRLDQPMPMVHAQRPPVPHVTSDPGFSVPYLTPSPSKDNNGVSFGSHDYTPTKPMNIPSQPPQKTNNVNPQWPTPPYDENDWAASAAASIFATQAAFR